MGWIYIFFAALFEIAGVIGLKMFSQKKTVKSSIFFLGGFLVSFILLYASFTHLDMSVAYAVWTGLGTAGAVAMNMILFGESKSARRILSLILIVIGVAGLKAVS